MPSFLQPDLQQIVSQAISFLLLLAILRRFAWKPLLSMLDERRARIEQDMAQAQQQRAELATAQQELTKRLATIDEEARAKIQQAVLEGKRIAGEVQEEARVQARQILEKANETIALEVAKAKVTLRDELADMTIEAVEDVLRQKLDPVTDRALVTKILDELSESAGSSR